MLFKNIIKNRQDFSHNLVFLLINLAIAFIIIFRTAYNASDLEVVPDSVEYAVAASRLVTDQSYTIVIDGQSWPPVCWVKAESGTQFNMFAWFPFKKRILNKNNLC